ncbi:MAG: collagen-like protein [candidate division Zixibacteria bacterium]|nr:collagen-like protein [candidate division Zixibacteria bacterium]
MKRVLLAVMLCLIMFACEGKQGPVGPQGMQGEQGPQGIPGTDGDDGAVITYVVGVVSVGDYNGNCIDLYNTNFQEDAITQVYISPDAGPYAWGFLSEFQMGNGVLYIYDPYGDYMGWDYMVMVIENSQS